VANGGSLPSAREVEPTLEDAYLLANLGVSAPEPRPTLALQR